MILDNFKIHNFDEENTINVFPNPFNDFLNLVFYSNDTSAINIQMFDLTGRMVLNDENIIRTPGCNSIPLTGISELSKGYYMLKVFSGTHAYSLKIFKAL